jgi:hypothetical protein
MPQHVVVDGSNLATEGRSQPSLQQLNEAVLAYMAEHPTALITVVVDATFGHRIDAKEVPDFDEAVSNNELVAPPAGAIGRGDAFVLSIANKVNATILSNDSYQEFHGDYPWLFDEGRLVGGKPVPHIGWVFVTRLPVRGPLSRKSVSEAKRKPGGGRIGKISDASVRVGSPDASKPMPVPKTPPPGAVPPGKPHARPTPEVLPAPKPSAEKPAAKHSQVNDLLTFLSFVEHHPVGTSVNAVVDHYSSHGAYVKIGDVVAYVPLRLMADPAPRSAREFMKVGESITLVVESFAAAKRSIDLAVPGQGSAVLIHEPAKPSRGRKKAAPVAEPAEPAKPRRVTKKVVAPAPEAPALEVAPAKKAPAKKAAVKKVAAKAAPVKKAAAKKVAAEKAKVKTAPVKKASAKKAVAPASPRRRGGAAD